MLRGLVVLLALGLAVGAWLLLRASPPPAAARVVVVEQDVEPEPFSADLREARQVAPERTLAETPDDAGPDEPAVTHDGVLAGGLLVDGAPLDGSAALFLAAADRDNPAHYAANGEFRTDALGRFRREGLPADWSGTLILRPPYVVPLEVTQGSGWSQGVQVERLREDLWIEVERRPQVRVRALHADLTPAVGVTVRLNQIRGGGTNGDSQRTDAEGRAMVQRTEHPPARIELSAHAEDGASVARLFEGDSLPAPDLDGDMDLGDVVLVEGRSVALRFVDEAGEVLTGLRLSLVEGKRKETLQTDEAGTVALGFTSASTRVDVEADGWWPAAVLLPAGVEEHDVVLRRANRLRVEVVDADDRPLAGHRVRLQARRPLFGEGRPFPPGFLLSHRSAGAGNDGETYRCDLPLDEEGAVECSGFTPGLELLVLVRAPFETVLAQERVPGLGETEQRSVRLRVERTPCTLEVRVLDAGGRPVAHARVNAIHEDMSTGATTDTEGIARIEDLAVPLVELRAQSEASTEVVLPDVSPCAGPVTIHLDTARTLEVALRDAEGNAVRAGTLVLTDASGEQTFERRTPTGGFVGLPFEPLTLVWSLCGEERRLAIAPDQTSAVVEVPPLGEVVVAVEGWTRGERQHTHLRIAPLDGTPRSCDDLYLAEEPRTVPLWPGRYRLTAEVRDYTNGVPPVVTPLGGAREVQVDAGSTQLVTFRP